jgi:hypothetical protein
MVVSQVSAIGFLDQPNNAEDPTDKCRPEVHRVMRRPAMHPLRGIAMPLRLFGTFDLLSGPR